MSIWLLLDVELQFENAIRTKISRDYWVDLMPEGSNVYYGMHFVSAPEEIHSGDRISGRVLLRAYPEDPCLSFQPGKKIFVKEGRTTVAEGVVTNRLEHNSQAVAVVEVLKELRGRP